MIGVFDIRDTPPVEVIVCIVTHDAVCDDSPDEVVVLLVAKLVNRPSAREILDPPRLSWLLWELTVEVARGSGLPLSRFDLRKGLLCFLVTVRGSANPEMCIVRRAESELGSRLNFFFKVLCILGAIIKLTLVVATNVMISETPRKNTSVDVSTSIIAIGSPITML
jgi:hypothetical protein